MHVLLTDRQTERERETDRQTDRDFACVFSKSTVLIKNVGPFWCRTM